MIARGFYIDQYGKLQDPLPFIQGQLRFRARERIGVAIVNPRGVAKGEKSIIVGT
jgi:hypothetical protein